MSCRYHQPNTVPEALQLLETSPEAKLIAGGTDLMVQMAKSRSVRPPALISLNRIEELTRIEGGNRLRIGSAVPVRQVAAHPTIAASFPAMVEAIRVLGSPQIRNVATLGGNLGNASPAADTAPPLVAYGAKVELRDATSTRQLPVEDFIVGPGQTDLRPGEILTAVLLEPPAPGTRSVFMRKGRVKMDLAIASVAALVEMDGPTCVAARLAAGAVAPKPLRLTGTEGVVVGSDLGQEPRRSAATKARAEVSPISDLRASEEYRRHLIGVFVERCLAALAGGDAW